MMRLHPCSGCRYFFGTYLVNRCCNYIFIEDRRRPCPPGKGCTVKELRPAPHSVWGRCARTTTGKPLFEKVCVHCGAEFTTTRVNKLYCSDPCRDRAKSARAYQRKKER